MNKMTNKYFGAPQRRNEDPALLKGEGFFVADLQLPGMVHAAFVRSPYASARIESIDVSEAMAKPGVHAVFVASDLGDYCCAPPLVVPPPPIEKMEFNARTQAPLAKDVVRYAGEPVAVVVADSRAIAEDAAELVWVEYEDLPVSVDLEKSASPDAPRVHEDLPGNLAARVRQSTGDFEDACSKASVVLKRRLRYEHGMAQPMETRGLISDWDKRSGKLTVWASTQAPTLMRSALSALMGMSTGDIHVIAPHVGGGFGVKVIYYYPEESLVPWLARKLKRPVKWIEDRSEHFVATVQERGQIHDVEMALTADGKILGIKDVFLHDCGAYNPYGLTVTLNSQCSVLGNYRVPVYDSTMICVYTNTPVVGPYRGAGRQHGHFVIERMLDIAARELDLDVNEIRRRNYIPPEAFPYSTGLIFQDFTELVYDSGRYEEALDLALEKSGYDGFRSGGKARLRAEGRHVGLGIVSYTEGTGIGPYEGAKVHVEPGGRVRVATGIGTQGQGHFTSFAQIVADQLGVKPSDVDIVTGDTEKFYWGAGTFASRGAVVAGNAVYQAAAAVREKALKLAARQFNCTPREVVLEDGHVFARNRPENRIAIGQLAQLANPMRGAVTAGTEPGLEATDYFGPERGTMANGVHAVMVEVDPDTFFVKLLKYFVVHDCGTVINPMIVEGQIHGGVAQGIGNAFFEKIIYDDEGQLLSATLADYLMPTSMEICPIDVGHLDTPSKTNDLGIKGVGEAGAIPVAAAFAQAVEDALDFRERGIEILEAPLSPEILWRLSSGAKQ